MKAPHIMVATIIVAALHLTVSVLADMGAHPEATFTITLNEKQFNDALISLQECGEDKRYSASDYSIAGLGAS